MHTVFSEKKRPYRQTIAEYEGLRITPPYEFQVIDETLGQQYAFRVNLTEVYCTCGKFQDRGFPCAHFAAACANTSQT